MGPDGPRIDEDIARVLISLRPEQIQKINATLKSCYQEYLAVEEKHVQRKTDEQGHLVITIPGLKKETAALENRLWSELDAVLDADQRASARLNLTFGLSENRPGKSLKDIDNLGLFGWGAEGCRIEIWRVGTWFHWLISPGGHYDPYSAYKNPPRGPQLPPEIQRFWEEPPPKAGQPNVTASPCGLRMPLRLLVTFQ
jgi:hypothetical protein